MLLHGRGADEYDLYPLLDALDPERRLLGVTPRGPLSLPPGGAHWYQLGGIPTPDPETFHPSFAALAAFLDDLPVPPGRIVLGGFSQGAVMSYALGLGEGRPRAGRRSSRSRGSCRASTASSSTSTISPAIRSRSRTARSTRSSRSSSGARRLRRSRGGGRGRALARDARASHRRSAAPAGAAEFRPGRDRARIDTCPVTPSVSCSAPRKTGPARSSFSPTASGLSASAGETHELPLERIVNEPFPLRDRPRYALVIDRLAWWYHLPREWLKKIALMDDVYLLNNPFTFQSMEKHAAYCAMLRLGLKVPETWMVPHKLPPSQRALPRDGEPATTPRSSWARSGPASATRST